MRKQNSLKLLLCAMLMAIGTNVWGATYSHTFSTTEKTFTADGTVTLSGVDWTLATTWVGSDKDYNKDTNSPSQGMKIGSNNKAINTMTLSTSGISGTITSVYVETNARSGAEVKMSVTVGGTAFSGDASFTGTGAYDSRKKLTYTGSASGQIVIAWDETNANSSKKGAFYVTKIEVVYETTGGCTNSITITKGAENHGTFTLSQVGDVCIDEGYATVNLVATPAAHYHLKSVTSTAGIVGEIANNKCTISDIDGDATITAVFEEDVKYAITITEPTNGSVSVMNGESAVASGDEVYVGTTLTIAATPAKYYKLNKILVNDGDSHEFTVNPKTYTINAATTITATFVEKEQLTVKFMDKGVKYHEDVTIYEGDTYADAWNGVSNPANDDENFADYKFIGWSKSNDLSSTPVLVVNTEVVVGSCTLYAIYRHGTISFNKTAISALTEDDAFVIVNTPSASAMPAVTNPDAVEVTFSADKNQITSEVADNLLWNIKSAGESAYGFYPNGVTDKWLWFANSNDGVSVGTETQNSCNVFTYENYVDGSNSCTTLKANDKNSNVRLLSYYSASGTSDFRCYKTSSSYWKGTEIAFYKRTVGEMTYSLENTYEVTFSNNWASFCAAEKVALPEGVVAYKGAVNGEKLTLTPVDGNVLPAGVGVMLKSNETSATLTESTEEASTIEGNQLLGTTEVTDAPAAPAKAYCYSKSQNAFAPVDEGFKIPANKAYLVLGAGAPSRISIVENVATSVENNALNVEVKKVIVNGQMMIIRGGNMFDLNGRLVK